HTRFDCDWSSDVCSSDLIRESLEIALRMSGRHPGQRLRRCAEVPMPGAQPRPGFAGGLVDECVRFLLMPLETRPGPIEPDREPIFFPAGDLRAAERAFRPALQPQE